MATFIIIFTILWIIRSITNGNRPETEQPAAQPRISRTSRKRTFTTPTGEYYTLFQSALEQPHLLIAGATGSGKSVVINGLISTLLYRQPFDCKGGAQLILIDPKRVELAAYADLPHTIAHAAGFKPEEWLSALNKAIQIMDNRYAQMERQRVKSYTGGDLFIVIDEWANVYKNGGKEAYKAILRLTSEGRAARVHVIMATQVPKATIIPTEIRENFAARLCLRTVNATQSRVIMDENGCEDLPRYGQGFYMTPEETKLYNIPMVPETEIERLINHWEAQTGRRAARSSTRQELYYPPVFERRAA